MRPSISLPRRRHLFVCSTDPNRSTSEGSIQIALECESFALKSPTSTTNVSSVRASSLAVCARPAPFTACPCMHKSATVDAHALMIHYRHRRKCYFETPASLTRVCDSGRRCFNFRSPSSERTTRVRTRAKYKSRTSASFLPASTHGVVCFRSAS